MNTLYGDRKQKIRAALVERAKKGHTIFYSELGALVGIPATGPWKPVLDEISHEETAAGRPDITYLVISKKTILPAQIGFKSAKPPTPSQRSEAAEVIRRIFEHYRESK